MSFVNHRRAVARFQLFFHFSREFGAIWWARRGSISQPKGYVWLDGKIEQGEPGCSLIGFACFAWAVPLSIMIKAVMITQFGEPDGVGVSEHQGLHYDHSDHQQELGFVSTSSGHPYFFRPNTSFLHMTMVTPTDVLRRVRPQLRQYQSECLLNVCTSANMSLP
jgi:hypothetical protein